MNKKITLVGAFALLFTGVFAQQSDSDDPQYYNPPSAVDAAVKPAKPAPESTTPKVQIGGINVDGTIAPCDGGPTTLVASGGCSTVFNWYSDSAATNLLVSNDSLTTSALMNDTTFYVETFTGDGQTQVPLPNQGSTFSGNVRGYWFQAPVDFWITGIRVPTDANTGNQNVAILRFNNGAPPLWSTTTNDFATLGYWPSVPGTDIIDTCIQVFSGEYIGVLGSRNDVNSYAGAPYASDIGGNPITLTRMGMQYALSSNAPQQIFQESGGSISRVELYYSLTATTDTLEVNVTVPQSYNQSVNLNVCDGDSLFLEGAWQTTPGVYYDTLFSVFGCDSISEATLSVTQSYDDIIVNNMCNGDSIWAGGAYQTTSGIYQDFLQTLAGCDSTVTSIVNFYAPPTVSYTGETMCTQSGTVQLTDGTPAGGAFSGTNVSANMFDAGASGAGTFPVTYTYTDTIGCEGTATANVMVLDCASLDENTLEGVSVYPNPATTHISISLPDHMKEVTATLFDAGGKVVNNWTITGTSFNMSIEQLSKGMYVLEVQSNEEFGRYKIIKE